MENKCPLCARDNPDSEWLCEACGAKLPLHGVQQVGRAAPPAAPGPAMAPPRPAPPVPRPVSPVRPPAPPMAPPAPQTGPHAGWPAAPPPTVLPAYSPTAPSMPPVAATIPIPRERLHTVRVSGTIFDWPAVCCCCLGSLNGAPPNMAEVYRVSVQTFPLQLCGRCALHMKLHEQAPSVFNAGGCITLLSSIIWVPVAIYNQQLLYILLMLLPAILGLIFQQNLKKQAIAHLCPGCAALGRGVRSAGSYGTVHTFQFTNESYSLAFMQANRKKVVM